MVFLFLLVDDVEETDSGIAEDDEVGVLLLCLHGGYGSVALLWQRVVCSTLSVSHRGLILPAASNHPSSILMYTG